MEWDNKLIHNTKQKESMQKGPPDQKQAGPTTIAEQLRAVQQGHRKKAPKQDGYAIYIPGKGPQQVTREVYVYWCKSLRREKYEIERDRRHGVLSYDEYMRQAGDHSRLIPAGGMRSQWGQSVEQALEQKRLREELSRLPEKDQDLMMELYGSQRSLREIARERDVSHQALGKQRDRILRKLAENLEDIKEAGK